MVVNITDRYNTEISWTDAMLSHWGGGGADDCHPSQIAAEWGRSKTNDSLTRLLFLCRACTGMCSTSWATTLDLLLNHMSDLRPSGYSMIMGVVGDVHAQMK